MYKDENRAYKLARTVQGMIKEKEFGKEQVRKILSVLLEINGYGGIADALDQGHDLRDFDEKFENGRFADNRQAGVITFSQLAEVFQKYNGRFELEGVAAKGRGRSTAYKLDTGATKQLKIMFRVLEDKGEAV